MKKEWAEKMVHLLSPSNILVCVEFPLYKDPNEQSPPWGLQGLYWNLLGEGVDGILHESGAGHSRQGWWKRLLSYSPERTCEVREGTDMVSMWRLT
ncbi:uncharacterized protein A1O5_11911 [Cladophialophora psammophila CBS 110553]|uniref:Uncharacterized protein n=1 Tax=Cladophialophora psammophila CBS 110553 TaxID=1182543 RepID=W9W0A2_9EURO|nr:uncharacterized protein A1O5_11911 [Cladophialophora psammophila CBS 110553]EXJ61353.1 hypothetical protein A1O5_11911 [Cladophialophora psammophila CBS 110553]